MTFDTVNFYFDVTLYFAYVLKPRFVCLIFTYDTKMTVHCPDVASHVDC